MASPPPPPRLAPNVVLTGFMGTGKTTVGKLVDVPRLLDETAGIGARIGDHEPGVLATSHEVEWRYQGSVITSGEGIAADYCEYSFTTSRAMRYDAYFHPRYSLEHKREAEAVIYGGAAAAADHAG